MTRAPHSAVVALTAYGVLLGVTGVALASTQPNAAIVATAVADLPKAAQDPVAGTASPGRAPTAAGPSGASSPGQVAASAGTSQDVQTARPAVVAPGQRITFWPTQLVMPSGAVAKVDQSGVDSSGALMIPQLPDVGVWNGGARAGELYGSVVIAGHVDSRTYGVGVFAELQRLRIGDRVTVRHGRTHLSYRVYRTDQVSQQSMAKEGDIFRQDVPNRLVLITCAGPFDPVKHGYRDNYIVYATPTS